MPAKIHKDHHNWIPPLYSDEWEFFNAKKNKSFSYSDVIMLLAFSDKDPQGYLVEGFNEPIAIATHCNYAYLVDHLKALDPGRDGVHGREGVQDLSCFWEAAQGDFKKGSCRS